LRALIIKRGRYILWTLFDIMAAMSFVLLKGVLLDIGRDCEVLASRQMTKDGPVYIEYRVIDAQSDIPDGDYTLRFEGRTVPTRKRKGHWMMDTLD
jgi:hypothetical protein